MKILKNIFKNLTKLFGKSEGGHLLPPDTYFSQSGMTEYSIGARNEVYVRRKCFGLVKFVKFFAFDIPSIF